MGYRVLFLISLLGLGFNSFGADADIPRDAAAWEAEVRGGFSVRRHREQYWKAEAGVSRNLDWKLDLPLKLSLGPRLNGSAGWLTAGDDFGFVFCAGLGLILTRENSRFYVEAGSGPAGITRHKFGDDHLGGAIQFISHVGFHCRFTGGWTGSYRYEHMSNAGIYSSNPGLNMHLFGVSYQF